MSYELKTEKFSGPLNKLLELIESREMEISEISLSAVTDDFLDFIKSLNEIEVPILVDFISIASRLVLLKSKSLLSIQEEDEEEEIEDLETRLRLYREIKPTMKIIASLWEVRAIQYDRPYFLGSKLSLVGVGASQGIFYPGTKLSSKILRVSINNILETFQAFAVEEGTIKEKIITLEQKIKEILVGLNQFGNSSFGNVARTKNKVEVIIAFLAILHLAHDKLISLEQENSFSDIMIKKLES